ncbi:transcriptional regulator [Haemophilus paracuniculus]|uniref:Transcriptional regulator n=1 Tax=Haemophilus paracuniculus TaxID=734 RepID=A0A1T0ASY3_9PAST|nr:helix-turn-helix transcriptional regulator [Haemophilus paracuniculus]OOR99599.1 transcriptional regulator [Haemophilus paracuniculus]
MIQLVADPIDKLIGKRIQLKRKELGYSAERLSEHIGISQQQLSRYERGVNKINVSHLVALATFMNTPINYFFMDCLSETIEQRHSKFDQHWYELSDFQKEKLVEFLDTLKK